MSLFVVIPAHNEEEKIGEVLERIKEHSNNIIVVDDGSKDNTYEIASSRNVTVLKHEINLGKGAAIKTGCDYAISKGANQLILIDADGQHDPQEIPKFEQALTQYQIIFGKRITPTSMPKILLLGNRLLSSTIKFLYNIKVDDSQCGYRALTVQAYRKTRWSAQDYFMETEMIIKAGKHKLSHTQIPIETIYSDKYKGTTITDGFKIMAKLLGWRILR